MTIAALKFIGVLGLILLGLFVEHKGRRPWLTLAIFLVAAALALWFVSSAEAGISSASIRHCAEAGEYEFRLEFTEDIDLERRDQYRRGRDNFQFRIWFDEPEDADNSRRVVFFGRSDLIELREIVDRRFMAPYNNPELRIEGQSVVFTVPVDILGDPDGELFYEAYYFKYGASDGVTLEGKSSAGRCKWRPSGLSIAPEPSSTWGVIKEVFSNE